MRNLEKEFNTGSGNKLKVKNLKLWDDKQDESSQ
jgi:hypothetical protein